ncbi:winged helix-turn-helix domain-containing protein [Paenibacillus planticolens]|uniref:ArsR family transcriptional regulator n=1 Tax=Paenibacillus planticolens TaxID=2654976 RepID=A0ABX1ZN55_9BACL|nr:winged helix-turn-helix domain-containing protein [Paenibacillus planticolens]NOV00998.1 ArsR family transcriptional regulator [Paenibacillus planticolens]
MSYQIETDFSPVHECLLSFLLYKRRQNIKYLYAGPEWIEHVKQFLQPDFLEKLEAVEELTFVDLLTVLVDQCPDSSSMKAFLDWISTLSVGDLYERLAAYMAGSKTPVWLHLGEERDRFVDLLSAWQEQYMSQWKGMEGIKEGALQIEEALKASMKPEDVVEKFVTGMRIELSQVKKVCLIPAYHFRPLHTFVVYLDKIYVLYPIAIEAPTTFTVSATAKALSDEKRLDILQLLSEKRRSFTEITKEIGGAKGNVHHHLMTLRMAGLVSVHLTDAGPYLALRPGLSERLKGQLDVVLEDNGS